MELLNVGVDFWSRLAVSVIIDDLKLKSDCVKKVIEGYGMSIRYDQSFQDGPSKPKFASYKKHYIMAVW